MTGDYVDIDVLLAFEPERSCARYCNKCGRMPSDMDTFCPRCNWHVLPSKYGEPFTLSMFRHDGELARYPKDLDLDRFYYNASLRDGIAHATRLTRLQRAKEKGEKNEHTA